MVSQGCPGIYREDRGFEERIVGVIRYVGGTTVWMEVVIIYVTMPIGSFPVCDTFARMLDEPIDLTRKKKEEEKRTHTKPMILQFSLTPPQIF